MKKYYVYIMASKSGTLYTGMTGELKKRVYEHKQKLVDGFTKKYGVDRLVFFEETEDVFAALDREKQIKAWRRCKRTELIRSMNPKWKDLSEDWF